MIFEIDPNNTEYQEYTSKENFGRKIFEFDEIMKMPKKEMNLKIYCTIFQKNI